MKQVGLFMLMLCIITPASMYAEGHTVQLDISDPQTKILWDSLNGYNAANKYYEAIPLLHRITEQAKESGEVEALGYAYENLAELKYLKNQLEEAEAYYQKAAVYLLQTENWDDYAVSLKRLASIATNIGDVDLALKYLNQIKQIIHKMPTQSVVNSVNETLGNAYFRNAQFDSSYHYRKRYLENVNPIDTTFFIRANLNMTASLIPLIDYDKALEYAEKALEYSNVKKYPLTHARAIGQIADIEHLKGNYNIAEEQFEKTINLLLRTKHSDYALSIFAPKAARNYLALDNHKAAKKMLEIAASRTSHENIQVSFDYYIAAWMIALNEKNIEESQRLYITLKESDENAGLTRWSAFYRLASRHFGLLKEEKTALRYYEKYAILKDSIANSQKVITIQNLEVKHQIDKKDIEIAEAETRIKLQQIGFGVGSFLVLSMLFLLYFNNKSKKKITEQNEVISKSLYDKEILLKEIHHRVKNNLQVISSLLSIQSRNIEDGAAKEAIIEGKTRVHSMSLIHQDLYRKDNLTGVRMDRYLGNLTRDLLNTYHVSEGKITLHQDIEPLKLDVDSVIPLGLIVNELMSNALKYAFPNDRNGQISVKLKEQNDCLYLQVTDDGIGLDKNQTENEKDSFGHALIRAFKNKLDADIDIKSEEGTMISLKIINYKKVS